mmetsp:Transcript_146669/g.258520  ORF Transcript_146669/g.258520 Transcript_146669/m.258520 type:complete len:720 (-) Transcript_146669:61-2220(-)
MSSASKKQRNSLPGPPTKKLYKVRSPDFTLAQAQSELPFPPRAQPQASKQAVSFPIKSQPQPPKKKESSFEAVPDPTVEAVPETAVLFEPQAIVNPRSALFNESTAERAPGGWRLARCFARLVCGETGEEETQVSVFPSVSTAVPPAPVQKPKAKAPPPPPKSAKAKGPPPPPPKAKQPSWKGQKPAPQWKTDKVVNCNPIRQQGLLEGSIWQQVNQTIEQRGDDAPLCTDTLNSAFMRLADESTKKRDSLTSRMRRRKKVQKQRVLPQKDTLKADLLYTQLVRKGIADVQQLLSIVGTRPPQPEAEIARGYSESSLSSSSSTSSSESTQSTDSDTDSERSSKAAEKSEDAENGVALNEDSLQILLDFLHLADGHEDQLVKMSGPDESAGDAAGNLAVTPGFAPRLAAADVKTRRASGVKPQLPLAAAEHLLQQLLLQVGPAALVQSRVSLMLAVLRFPKEADHLENIMRRGIDAARCVVNSTALPKLLQGYLHLVNYVNHSSKQLGSAQGVTLDSIAKLAHTRCRASLQKEGVQHTKRTLPKPTNALDLLVVEVQNKQEPTWLATLTSDLEGCRSACDLDYEALSLGIKDLDTQVAAIEERLRSLKASRDDSSEPPALTAARLSEFVASAYPRVAALRSLKEELESATADMRKYFAEPATSPLPAMLRSLATLLDALPRPEHAPANLVRNLVEKFNKGSQDREHSGGSSPRKAKRGGG